jgi:hypothetical protein
MVIGVLAAAGACAKIVGIEDLENSLPPPIEAGPDIAPRDPCSNPPAPDKPDAADGVTGSPFFFALDSVDFGSEFDKPGVNLDKKCTNDIDATSCVLTGLVPTGQIDGPGGVDNSGVNIIAGTVLPTSIAAEVKNALVKRAWTLLFRLDGWNGQSDDPSVELRVVSGVDQADAGTWSVDGNLTDGGIGSAPVSSVAWVTKDVVRAEFQELPFIARSVTLGTFQIRLQSAYVIATLSADRKKLTSGVIAGRWSADDITEEIKRLSAPIGGCIGKLLTDSHCRARDIEIKPSDDNKGFECDAVSTAFRFTAAQSTFSPDAVDAGGLSPKICSSDTRTCQ